MSFAVLASLVSAAADLKVVDSVTGAIRAADAKAGAANAGRVPPIGATAARPVASRGDRCEIGRRDYCCDISLRPTRTIHTVVTFNAANRPWRCRASQPEKTRLALRDDAFTLAPEAPSSTHPPAVQPPWATLPWREPTRRIVQVKVGPRRTDMVTKGTLIDVFI